MRSTAGSIVLLFGLFLFFGNIFGFFKTFPYAGFITMGVGSALIKEDE